jgi:hypothetical protein
MVWSVFDMLIQLNFLQLQFGQVGAVFRNVCYALARGYQLQVLFHNEFLKLLGLKHQLHRILIARR